MALITLLGAANIAVGIASIVFYAIIVGIKVPMYDTGTGLWAGSLFIVAGCIALFAGKAKHRMAFSFAMLFGFVALIADIASLAMAIYVFYFLTQVYPDANENMPIYQVYVAFQSLWFLVVLAAFFTTLLQIRTAWVSMPERRLKGGVYVEDNGQSAPTAPTGEQYQPAPRPYYY